MPPSWPASPTVTIGLAAYNRPDGLSNALASLTAQTYPLLRIVVADNASADPAVGRILEQYRSADPRIEVVRHARNIGQVENFRFLFQQATSEYFLWAADDDEWAPEFIEECVGLLERNPQTVLAFCHVQKRDPRSGAIVSPRYADDVACDSPVRLRRIARYLRNSASNECFYGIYRRSAITDWFFRRTYGNDHIALLSVLKLGSIALSPKVLFTSGIGGLGSARERYHEYYASRAMKMLVTLNSTAVWFWEFQRYAWTDYGYAWWERIAVSVLICRRFLQLRFLRRFVGDVAAVVTQPRIWGFLARGAGSQ